MGFEALLGNDRLKENLTGSISRGRISHFYLIAGPEGSGRHTLAKLLAAAILCAGRDKPCGVCSHCRKLMSGNHPDFITVQDPEHKNVAVKIVRRMRDDMFIRPNEAERKIYFFPQELGLEGQNALLKILEEPPAYGVFILLTDNPEKLLPTVRSRCTELTLQPLPAQILRRQLTGDYPQASREDVDAAIARSGGYLGQARNLLQDEESREVRLFAEAFARRDALALTMLLAPMEKWKRDQLLPLFSQWRSLLEEALACRAGVPVTSRLSRELGSGRSGRELMDAVKHLDRAILYAQSNVSCGAICGWLSWALR